MLISKRLLKRLVYIMYECFVASILNYNGWFRDALT